MKIGMNTDSLGELGFEEVLDAAVALGLDSVEFATGNWSNAPHIDIEALLGTVAQIMANDGQHLVVLRQALGEDAVPAAFEAGTSA